LVPKTLLALTRYCKAHGLTRTQAVERGIALLLKHEGPQSQHPAFTSFQRLSGRLAEQDPAPSEDATPDALKRHLDEKYPA
jgi:hypothetical protein